MGLAGAAHDDPSTRVECHPREGEGATVAARGTDHPAAIAERSIEFAIAIQPRDPRFSAEPIASLDNYIGVNRDVFVWDNYEFGHYLFPVVMREKTDQEFALRFTSNKSFETDSSRSLSPQDMQRLKTSIALASDHVDTLLVWGRTDAVDSALQPYFETTPYFENGRVRLYRRNK